MVTDEMVEKAADEMARQDITFANCDRGWQKCTIRAALEAALSAVAPPIRLPTALSLMIEKGVDPEQNGYCRVIDVEKFLCAKLGKEWSATGMSIVSLVDELAALSAQVQDVAGWKLVPIAPSAGMIAAAKSTTSAALTRSHATEIYRAMLAAAPAKQEGGTNE